ncbi:MAG TPA: MarR family transcriptional regulator [Verrucomicrobia bacterium]|nr:MarR family transcriptional regulator [Verrucomicrobiota bacterium]HOB33949.1 MarR family transcriptional regulator [Verrucomicrobiota bacterium]HOP97892.1 MarR family transcriptional regulator [Verrucomicrobiota bacterium]HPU55785.1 MarR family transcriptional regulator [Verrucomicrobiota bacterium]
MAPRKKLSKSQYENLAAFRYALRQFLRFSEDAARRAGLTPQQHQALLAVKGFPGRDTVTVSELAERLQIRHHSAVELLDRLERLKLVRREHSPKDRRRVMIRLTSRGEQLLDRLSSAHEDQLRRVGPALSASLAQLTASANPPGKVRSDV